jgi:multiple sugar transport system ATP-binding protein
VRQLGSITFNHVFKKYRDEAQSSVKDFHLEVEDGEFLVLVGPSGCGKSTTLRMLAGLEDITEGELYIDNKFMNYTSPKNRDIAMVFQNYALYPGLSVFENMALGLKLRKIAKHEIELRVNRYARILEISHLLDKKPGQLSGGQKQRVALGRAIVREPKVFLMDEPLSNLDAKLRAQTRAELIKLHSNLKRTTVYVTHDQVEAMTMGTRIVVMKDGVIQQVATPKEVYQEPANLFVAGFIGSPRMNFFNGSITHEADTFYFDNKRMRFPIPSEFYPYLIENKSGLRNIVMGLRPENIAFREFEQSEGEQPWIVHAVVEMTELMGADAYVYSSVGESTVIIRADADSSLLSGERVGLWFNMQKAHFFDANSGLSILARGRGE